MVPILLRLLTKNFRIRVQKGPDCKENFRREEKKR